MPKYVLKYFDAKGRGEVTRMIFALADVEYEDHRYVTKEWRSTIEQSEINKTHRLWLLQNPLNEISKGREGGQI